MLPSKTSFNKTRRVLLWGLLCFIFIIFFSCQTRNYQPIQYVPTSACFAFSIRWQEVRKDEYLKNLIKGSEIESILSKLNISSGKVNELVVFSNTASKVDGISGVIISGSLNVKDTGKAIESQGWIKNSYQSYKVYQNKSDDLWVVFLKSGLLALGTKMGVENVIDVERKTQTSFITRQPVNKLYSYFKKNKSPISIMVALPTDLQDKVDAALIFSSLLLNLSGLGQLGELINKIGLAQGINCSIAKNSNSFLIELIAVMKDESAASLLAGSLNLIKDAITLIPKASNAKISNFAESLSITKNREVVLVKLTVEQSEANRN